MTDLPARPHSAPHLCSLTTLPASFSFLFISFVSPLLLKQNGHERSLKERFFRRTNTLLIDDRLTDRLGDRFFRAMTVMIPMTVLTVRFFRSVMPFFMRLAHS